MRKHAATTGSGKCLLLLFLFFGCTTPEQRVTPFENSVSNSNASSVIAGSKTDTVEIKEMKFQPATLTVQVGTTIIFINNDLVTHDITEEESRAWSSNLLPPGKSWTLIADKSANYFCSIHAVMKGKIVVK
jgi:plastocyanin